MVEKLNLNKTPSADAIPTKVFECCSARLFRKLAQLFDMVLKHIHMPNELMRVTLVLIWKSKTLSAADSQKYRPFALTRSASKLLETDL